MKRVLKPGGHCYIMTNRITLLSLLAAAKENKFHLTNLLFWAKGRKNANRYYMIETEIICMFYNKPAKSINDCGQAQIHYCSPVKKEDRIHDTEKPVELIQRFIENSTEPGQLVLDPFAGSGSTAVAAIRSDRMFCVVELDETYYLQACGRIWGEYQK